MSDQAVLHAPVPSANGRSRVAHLTGIRKPYFKPHADVLEPALDGIDMSTAAGAYPAVLRAWRPGQWPPR